MTFFSFVFFFYFSEPKKTQGGHKKSLESLKEKDPEFYEFLQKEDQRLLEFEESDDGKR